MTNHARVDVTVSTHYITRNCAGGDMMTVIIRTSTALYFDYLVDVRNDLGSRQRALHYLSQINDPQSIGAFLSRILRNSRIELFNIWRWGVTAEVQGDKKMYGNVQRRTASSLAWLIDPAVESIACLSDCKKGDVRVNYVVYLIGQ